MLTGDAHSTSLEGELRIADLRISKTRGPNDNRARLRDHMPTRRQVSNLLTQTSHLPAPNIVKYRPVSRYSINQLYDKCAFASLATIIASMPLALLLILAVGILLAAVITQIHRARRRVRTGSTLESGNPRTQIELHERVPEQKEEVGPNDPAPLEEPGDKSLRLNHDALPTDPIAITDLEIASAPLVSVELSPTEFIETETTPDEVSSVTPPNDLTETEAIHDQPIEELESMPDELSASGSIPESLNEGVTKAEEEIESVEIESEPAAPSYNPAPASLEDPGETLIHESLTLRDEQEPTVTIEPVNEEYRLPSEEQPVKHAAVEQRQIEDQEQIAPEANPETQSTPVDAVSSDEEQDTRKRKRPPKYSPSIRTGEATSPKRTERVAEAQPAKIRSLSMRLRIVFGRRNYQFSLLPERTDDSPEELEVTSATEKETWSAYQDEWYQEITPLNLSALLGEGGIWESRNGKLRWVLSRREIYVLAPDSTISGYVQTSGLVLGQTHLVLCTESQQGAVRTALSEAGCADLVPIANGRGVPEGWILFADVLPSIAKQHEKEAGIYNILRPVHDVRIDLVGGIRLNHSTWLSGHAPTVRVLGANDSNISVLIDGQAASIDAEGNYTASDWNSYGRHTVFCGGISQSYELANGVEDWEFFIGHSYRQSQVPGDVISTCGPMIVPKNKNGELLFLPSGNNCLVGSIPGQVVFVAQPEHVRTSSFLAQSDFDVVWSLPADSLRCDKGTSRVRLITPIAPGQIANLSGRRERWAAVRWYQAILNASRKGLGIDPDTEEARNLWLDYKRRARELRRRLR